jgi:hypothetical protein
MAKPIAASIPPGPDCIEYGLLYNYPASLGDTDGNGAADTYISSSDDWFIPTNAIRDALDVYISDNGGGLKETGLVYWNSPNTGATNEYLFYGRGVGRRRYNDGVFYELGNSNYFWGSSPVGASFWCGNLGYNTSQFLEFANQKTYGQAIRLIKAAPGISDLETTTYTGNNGQQYTAVALNQYYWLQQNLVETEFRNGSVIPFHGADNGSNFTNAEWVALTTPGVCAYDNDMSYAGCDIVFTE